MKNKRIFNNLFDSICITLLWMLIVLIMLVPYIIEFQVKATISKIDGLILWIWLWLPGIIILSIWIITKCYEYWILTEKSICSKKIFRNKVVINLCEIEKVEKKVVSALILGTYQSEAYIIYSGNEKIVILINKRKKYYDLDNALEEFIIDQEPTEDVKDKMRERREIIIFSIALIAHLVALSILACLI